MKQAVSRADLPPGLYLVATPIGNLRDITLRALDVLAAVELIACEDTRHTRQLLSAHGIAAPSLCIYNDHSDERQRQEILAALAAEQSVALVSDAGTPLVSDPGYKLVRAVLAAGHKVYPLPGANAPLSALQLSGLPSDKFTFLGFLPPRREARRAALQEWRAAPSTLIAFESGPRLAESLADMLAVLGDRPAAVVREITKMFEESRRDTLSALAAFYADAPPKGEIVIVAGPPAQAESVDEDALKAMLADLLKTRSVRDAVDLVAGQSGQPRRLVYDLALTMAKDES